MASDVLAEKNFAPASYRDAFKLAGEHGILPADLAVRLQKAAGMRNVLVPLYESIDYDDLHQSIPSALQGFTQFTAIFVKRLSDD
ncbi:MAG: DUF86 domain-containing protein [Anaerolineae bacterium]